MDRKRRRGIRRGGRRAKIGVEPVAFYGDILNINRNLRLLSYTILFSIIQISKISKKYLPSHPIKNIQYFILRFLYVKWVNIQTQYPKFIDKYSNVATIT